MSLILVKLKIVCVMNVLKKVYNNENFKIIKNHVLFLNKASTNMVPLYTVKRIDLFNLINDHENIIGESELIFDS